MRYFVRVACPCFYPVERLEEWPNAPRLPLGGPFAGICKAVPGESWRPDEMLLRAACSFGYARGTCPRFPVGETADAVRFDARIGEDADAIWEVVCIMESQCEPLSYRRLEYSPAARIFMTVHDDEIVQRQAEVFVEARLRLFEHARRAKANAGSLL